MAEPITVDNGGGADYDVLVDDVTHGTLGTGAAQVIKIMDGTVGGTALIGGDATNGLDVDVTRVSGTVAVSNAALTELAGAIDTEMQVDVVAALPAGTNNIGDVDVLTVPADPFGANADAAVAAGATGSIQAKLRRLTTDLDAVKTAVEILDNAISGSEMQVDIVSAPTLTVNSHAVTNAGTFAVQVDGAALTALQLIDDTVFADDAAFTVGTSKVNAIGYMADEASTDSVDEGDVGVPRMTLDRKQIVTVQPHTTGGWDVKNCSSGDGSTALTNSAQAIKASAGKLGGWYIYNPNASAAYVPIYDVASGSVTVGTTNPLMVLTIPASSAANLELVNGITFGTAISAAAATTAAGNSALGTALEAIFFYK